MTPAEITSSRASERTHLIAAPAPLDASMLESLRRRIDDHLERSSPGLATTTVAFCWPIRGEYDARPLLQRYRDRGVVTALPVVVAPRQPLIFRAWHAG